ncbi:hypothetical protein CRUP_036866 [Coryphaenoides rupestris]|nr:hypothetical protein CRUP_036866 [Coryphaenoides rupestris]
MDAVVTKKKADGQEVEPVGVHPGAMGICPTSITYLTRDAFVNHFGDLRSHRVSNHDGHDPGGLHVGHVHGPVPGPLHVIHHDSGEGSREVRDYGVTWDRASRDREAAASLTQDESCLLLGPQGGLTTLLMNNRKT